MKIYRLQKRLMFIVIWSSIMVLQLLISSTAMAEETLSGMVITRHDPLNIRSGPGTNYPVIGKAGKNATLIINDTTGEWYRVQLPDGTEGYAAGKYLRILPATPLTAVHEALVSQHIGVVIDPEVLVYAETSDDVIYRPALHDTLFILDEVRQRVHSDGQTMMYSSKGEARVFTPAGEIGRIALNAVSVAKIGWLCGRLNRKDADEENFFVVHQAQVINDDGKGRLQYLAGENIYATNEARWVNPDEVTLLWHHVLIAAGRNLLAPSANRLYWIREEGRTRWKTHEKPKASELRPPERIFQHILDRYADAPYYLSGDENEYYEGYAGYGTPSGIIALDSLADIAIYQERYQQAISYLEQIAHMFPAPFAGITIPGDWSIGGPAAGVAALKIADIHAAYLNDPDATIQVLLRVIEDYPRAEVGGFEWNSTLDLMALDQLALLGEKHAIPLERMVQHYQTVIDISGFDVVKVQAAIAQAELLRDAARFSEAIEVLSKIIQRCPATPMTFYKTDIDFSVNALDLLLRIVMNDLNDFAFAVQYCQQIYQKQTAENLSGAALLLLAEILDNTSASREDAIRAYELALNAASPTWWEIYRPEMRSFFSRGMAGTRLTQIRTFLPYRAIVSGEQTPLYAHADSAAAVVTHLEPSIDLTVLYRTILWTEEEQRDIWYKVQAETGTVGWLPKREFSPDGCVRALKSPLTYADEQYAEWPMWGADKDRTRAIDGIPIKHPALRAVLHDVHARDVLFYDVNNDGLPDLIICGPGIMCIDGKTQESLWKVQTGADVRHSNPRIEAGVLYCGSAAIDVSTGNLKWKGGASASAGFRDFIDIDENVLYASWLGAGLGVYGFALETGETVLEMLENKRLTEILVNDGKLYATTREPYRLLCYDLKAQKIIWEEQTIASRLMAWGDLLLFRSSKGKLHARNLEDGQLLWTNAASPYVRAAIKDGRAYIGNKSCFSAVDLSTGATVWQQTKPDSRFRSFHGAPCIVDDVIYTDVIEKDGTGAVYALNVSDGDVIWKFPLPGSASYGHGGAVSSIGPVMAVMMDNGTLVVIGEQRTASSDTASSDEAASSAVTKAGQPPANAPNTINVGAIVAEMEQMIVDVIMADLQHDDEDVREQAISRLGKLPPDTSLAPLLKALQNSRIDVQVAAIKLLQNRPAAQVVPALLSLVNSSDAMVRKTAVSVLGKFPERRTLAPLLAALNDTDKSVRHAAANALSAFQKTPLKGVLFEALQEIDAQAAQAQKTPLLIQLITTPSVPLSKFLIREGADVNVRDANGRTALMVAIRQLPAIASALVRPLIEAGADVYAQDNDGKTVLDYAIQHQSNSIMFPLIEAGAVFEPEERQGGGVTDPFFEALFHPRPTVRVYAARALIQAQDERVIDVLIETFDMVYVDELKKITGQAFGDKRKPWVEWRRTTVSPLTKAIHLGHTRAALDLIATGADLHTGNPLCIAAETGAHEVVSALLTAGVAVDEPTLAGRTPLMYAIAGGQTGIINTLLASGADVNARDKFGYTPLRRAVIYQVTVETIRRLLSAGADVNAVDDQGSVPLISAAASGYTEIVRTLITAGADVNACSRQKYNALKSAARNGHLETVRILLEHNADPDVRNLFGWTALMYAAQNGHREIVAALLEAGADSELADKDGERAIDFARKKKHMEIVELLEHAAAQLHGQEVPHEATGDNAGQTPDETTVLTMQIPGLSRQQPSKPVNLPMSPVPEPKFPGDLAWNKPTFASSYWKDGYPSKATSGGAWRSAGSTGSWLYVDLGTPQPIQQIVTTLFVDANFSQAPRTTYIVSNDLKTWQRVYEETNPENASKRGQPRTLTLPAVVTARYVGMYATGWDGGWASISVFAVLPAAD